jgi:xanthine dehydrogenase accessory factor
VSPIAPDREVLQAAHGWLEAGHPVALVTVCRTWGSSPRPVGSLLAMRPDGHSVGSVSGGCIEEDLLSRYCGGELASPAPTRLDYGVDRADAERFGLPCGGRLELLVEHLSDAEGLGDLLEMIIQGQQVKRVVDIASGATTLQLAKLGDAFEYGDRHVGKVFGSLWRLLLIGDNQLARYLASMAVMVDFAVTVCDPRDSAFRKSSEGVFSVCRAMPDDAVVQEATDPRRAVITLAHDPRLDDLALMEALSSDAFYVGALGSRRTNAKRRERLAQLGVAASDLARLHAPVGLDIGSRTPAEIALAIIADVVATRNALGRAEPVSPAAASL